MLLALPDVWIKSVCASPFICCRMNLDVSTLDVIVISFLSQYPLPFDEKNLHVEPLFFNGERMKSDLLSPLNSPNRNSLSRSIEIIEEIGQELGKHIAGLINLFNPEMVIIGGTLSLADDYLIQPIKTAIKKYSLNLVNKDSIVTASKLRERAGVVGACLLARSRMFED